MAEKPTRHPYRLRGRINHITPRQVVGLVRAWWCNMAREYLEEGLALIFNEEGEMIPKFAIRLPNGLILSVEGAEYRSWSKAPETEADLAAKMAAAIATTDWPAVNALYGSRQALTLTSEQVAAEHAAAAKPARRMAPKVVSPAPTAVAAIQEQAESPAPQQPQPRKATSLKAVTDLLSRSAAQ